MLHVLFPGIWMFAFMQYEVLKREGRSHTMVVIGIGYIYMDIWDDILSSYLGGYFLSHYKDPVFKQPGFNGK